MINHDNIILKKVKFRKNHKLGKLFQFPHSEDINLSRTMFVAISEMITDTISFSQNYHIRAMLRYFQNYQILLLFKKKKKKGSHKVINF